GKSIVAGDFGISRLNTNGLRDTNFVTVVNQTVNAVVVQPDGKVLIGGNFTVVNGTSRTNLTRLNTNGTLDTSFVATADNGVFSVALQPDGKVLVGGLFLSVNGVARSHIARLNANGSLDTSFLNGLVGADGRVTSFALQPDGRIL